MDNPLFNLHTSDSDKIEITRATNPESRVRSSCHFFYYKPRNHGPESGEGRQQSPGGCPKTQSPKRMALGRCTWFQIQDPRSGVTEVSRPGAPKVQDPDSGRRPVALPRSQMRRNQSPESGGHHRGPGERGQPAGSRVRPPEARPRQQREGRDPGSKVRLSGEGTARGRIQRGREGEPGLRGSLVLMKTPRKQALSVRPERRISHHSVK